MTQTPLSQAGPSTSLRPPPWSYTWWALTGTVVGFGFAGLLTIGIFLLPVGLAMVVVGCLWKPLQNSSATAAIAGLAAAPLYIAWVNRDGPGTVCETIGDGTSCAERWSPWPFLAVAVVMVAVSVTAATKMRRSRRSP